MTTSPSDTHPSSPAPTPAPLPPSSGPLQQPDYVNPYAPSTPMYIVIEHRTEQGLQNPTTQIRPVAIVHTEEEAIEGIRACMHKVIEMCKKDPSCLVPDQGVATKEEILKNRQAHMHMAWSEGKEEDGDWRIVHRWRIWYWEKVGMYEEGTEGMRWRVPD